MDTITMWAEKSSNVSDARLNRPLNSTSKPAPISRSIDARTVTISSDDIAKIHQDAENAIKIIRKQNGN